MENIEYKSSSINASECLSQGWELIKSNYWTFLGMVIVQIVIGILVSLIPFAGAVINVFISAPLVCGIYLAMLVQLRGERVNFSMMFEGFSRFLPTVLVTLIAAVPLLIFSAAFYFIGSLSALSGANDTSIINSPSVLGRNFNAPLILTWLAVYLVTLVIQFLVFFALPLIADHDLGFVDAVKLSASGAMSNVGGLIVLFLLEFLVMLVGLLAFCIGFLFVLPIVYAANIIAYRSVFPDSNQPPQFNEPPRPDAYNGTYGMPT